MPNYPEPGNLANANGLTFPGVAALPGGVVFGRDGQVIREMLSATSLNGGDAVILAPSLASVSPYFVTRTSVSESPLRYGVVVGARVGTEAASAASRPVWVAIEGPAWARSDASVSLGDLLSTTSVGAIGALGKSIGRNRAILGVYQATVSFAGSLTSAGGGTYYQDVNVAPASGYSSNDVPFAFIPNASLAVDLSILSVFPAGSVSAGIRIGTVGFSLPTASQVSIPGTLLTAITSQPVPGAILGVVLTSTSAVSIAFLMHVDKR